MAWALDDLAVALVHFLEELLDDGAALDLNELEDVLGLPFDQLDQGFLRVHVHLAENLRLGIGAMLFVDDAGATPSGPL